MFFFKNPSNDIRVRDPFIVHFDHRHLPFWVHLQKPNNNRHRHQPPPNLAHTLSNHKSQITTTQSPRKWMEIHVPLGLLVNIDQMHLVGHLLLLQSQQNPLAEWT